MKYSIFYEERSGYFEVHNLKYAVAVRTNIRTREKAEKIREEYECRSSPPEQDK